MTEQAQQTINIEPVVGDQALYCQYPGQSRPQDTYVEINCKTGQVWATYNGEIGNAVPAAVWSGHSIRWSIPIMREGAVNEAMEQLRPEFERIVAGYDTRWNGNNHVPVFSDDAYAAREEIFAVLDQVDEENQVAVWEPQDWLENSLDEHEDHIAIDDVGTITADTTDEQLDELAQVVLRDAATNHDNVIVVDVEEYLRDLRTQVCDNNV